MLSRIAESLYWVGRYVERAEDTARILDVHIHHLLEDASVEEDVACRALLGVMGITGASDPVDINRVTERLAFDASNGTSIRGALVAARRTPAAPRSRCPPSCGSASTARTTPCPLRWSEPPGRAHTPSSAS